MLTRLIKKIINMAKIINNKATKKVGNYVNCIPEYRDNPYAVKGKDNLGNEVVVGFKFPHKKSPQPKPMTKWVIEKYSDGNGHTRTKKVKNDSFIKLMNSYIIKPLTHDELREGMIQHKIQKWDKKNPNPVSADASKTDLFYKETLEPKELEWKKMRQDAVNRITEFVAKLYGVTPAKATIVTMPPKEEDNVEKGEFWGRWDNWFRNPETKQLEWNFEDRKIADNVPLNDDNGQSRTNYEKILNTNFYVGTLRKDGKIIKAYMPNLITNSDALKIAA